MTDIELVKRNVRMVHNVMDEIKDVTTHATLNMAQAFLHVSINPGVTVGEVQKCLGLPPTSTARAVSVLMERARGRDGLGLVETYPDAIDGRIKHLRLTTRGARLWSKVMRHLDR